MTPRLQLRIDRAPDYGGLWRIARDIFDSMPSGRIAQVCGPISTGGTGSRDLNCLVFRLVIKHLQARGLVVFDQMPFQDRIVALSARYARENGGAYDQRILREFYGPLFRSGKVTDVHFLPGSESSTGAMWERGLVSTLGGIKIHEFPNKPFRGILRRAKDISAIQQQLTGEGGGTHGYLC